ncbi:MAG: hypothetical protein HUJ54_11295 [Erysipelotrichaceae bacterium]|nr:hypothetical protein [Erysipelotrichaceae bacterium]
MKKKKYTKKQRVILSGARSVSVLLFAAVMVIGLFTGSLFFLRPNISALEKRELTAFPAFSLAGILDGSWFENVALWYSDTYPGREGLMAMNNSIRNLYGLQTSEAFYGGGKADAIPDTDKTADSSSSDSEKKSTKQKFDRTEAPDTFTVTEEVQAQVMEGLLVKDGGVYGAYYFIKDSADQYVDVLNRAAEELDGITNVYCMLIPNNSSVMLEDSVMKGLGGSDPKQAAEYYYSSLSGKVTPVPVIDALRDHKDEYLYYRTDHHWSAQGAYYAYLEWCKAKGIDPVPLEERESHTYEPFLGSYYSELKRDDLLADSVTGYVPVGTNEITIYTGDANGNVTFDTANMESCKGSVFNTSDGYDEYSQYLRFIGGDFGLAVIDNPKISDGTSCMVIKESYGNALIPFLVDHYDKIYVVDERYNTGKALQFCKDNKVTDLLIASNMQIAAASSIPPTLDSLLQ